MTSGPVNTHLTPGPGIYFNAFIHVYSPRAGADNPLGKNVDVNRKPLSLCPFVARFKTISLKYDFKHILNDFIPVYWFWRRRFLKGLYYIWAWWPSLSCDPDPANKLLFILLKLHMKFGFDWPGGFGEDL